MEGGGASDRLRFRTAFSILADVGVVGDGNFGEGDTSWKILRLLALKVGGRGPVNVKRDLVVPDAPAPEAPGPDGCPPTF